jgi:hypothetical protein
MVGFFLWISIIYFADTGVSFEIFQTCAAYWQSFEIVSEVFLWHV